MKKLILLFVLLCTAASGEEKPKYEYENNPNLAPSTMPVICGHPNYVHKFITGKGFALENASLGRAGAQPKVEPVMMISMYSKEDQLVGTVDIPSGESTCIMYHTFNRTELKTKEN